MTSGTLNCIIVDDEHNARQVIKRYLDKISWLTLKDEFKDPMKALELVGRDKVDVVFLDINMPELSGIEFIKSLSNKPQIIFTTAYADFALEGYENDVLDYLLKPIRFERFLKAISKIERVNTQPMEQGYVMVRSGHGLHRIQLKEINYLQKDSNYIEIHVDSGQKVLIRENMSNIFQVFPERLFIRIHKSYVVSKSKIKVIEAHQVTLANAQKIPVGASYREELMKEFPYLK